MVRTLSSNLATKVATLHGTEPYYVVKIEWTSGTVCYASKAKVFDGFNCKAYLQNTGDISAVANTDNYGESSTFSIVLFGETGSLKDILDTDVMERTTATLYMMFENIDDADALILIKGVVSGDIAYSEIDRKLSFEIESIIDSNEIGYAPAEDEFANLNPDGVDKAWPLCYGTVLRVPTAPVYKKIHSITTVAIQGFFSTGTIVMAKVFEEGPTLTFTCGGLKFTGTVDGTLITFVTMNDSYYTDVAILDRPLPADDPSYFDASVCWVSSDVDLTNKYCTVFDLAMGGWAVNWCIRQEGTKCHFVKPWGSVNQQKALDSTNVMTDVAGFPKPSWPADMTVPSSLYDYNWRLGSWEVNGDFSGYILTPDSYEILPHSVFLQLTGVDDVYVCNLGATTAILEVFSHRPVNGEKALAPIPSRYYATNLSDTINGKSCTTLTFYVPLAQRDDGAWEDEIYVSLTSAKSSSTPAIIEDLLTTYTNITVDAASFAAVAADLATYPSHVAFLEQEDALSLCEEIAYEARCALYVYNNVAYLKYLSKAPASTVAISDADTIDGSVRMMFTTYEDVETRVDANWKLDYSGEEDTEWVYTYKNNIEAYGLREEERTYKIYNIKALVKASVDFWGHRDSNIWRVVSFSTPLQTTALQLFDDVSLSLAILSSNTIDGIVIDQKFAVAGDTVTYKVLLASRAGVSDGGGQPLEESDFWSVAAVSVTNPGLGLSQTDYIVDFVENPGSGNTHGSKYTEGNGSVTVAPTAPATPTPTTPPTTSAPGCSYSDPFTRANENPLSTPYALINTDGTPDNMQLITNRVVKSISTGEQFAVYYRVACDADHYAQVDYNIVYGGSPTGWGAVAVRFAATPDAYPAYLARITGNGILTIDRLTDYGPPATYDTLGTIYGQPSAGTLKLTVIGDELRAYIDGNLKLTITDTAIAGEPATAFGAGNTAGSSSATFLDNFETGDL